MTDHRRGGTVHPTQARLAWQDHETWEPVTVLQVDPPLIVVTGSDGETRRYRSADAGWVGQAANDGTTEAFVTDRWGVLAIQSEHGQVLRNPNADHSEPGSVWVMSGADRLRFVSVRRDEDESE